MSEWNVYVDGRFIGTVLASDEGRARYTAMFSFDIPENARLFVERC